MICSNKMRRWCVIIFLHVFHYTFILFFSTFTQRREEHVNCILIKIKRETNPILGKHWFKKKRWECVVKMCTNGLKMQGRECTVETETHGFKRKGWECEFKEKSVHWSSPGGDPTSWPLPTVDHPSIYCNVTRYFPKQCGCW